ncbi:hypothetical protein BGZ74_001700 [Mortierella antarctica]|nr:hypothetical protein BGZ74_001700 [Mortierella antarctica]
MYITSPPPPFPPHSPPEHFSNFFSITMHKSLVLLLAVYSSVAVAVTNHVYIYNNNKSKSQVFGAIDTRFCACVKNTQTGFIKGVNGGDIKLFSSSDLGCRVRL